jgi:hypothetical protein
LPGAYLEGRFLVEKKTSAIVIPSDIVMYRKDRQFVYVAQSLNSETQGDAGGSRARLVEIHTGEGKNGQVIVTAGLSMGDQVIVSGNRTLFDGALIANETEDVTVRKP